MHHYLYIKEYVFRMIVFCSLFLVAPVVQAQYSIAPSALWITYPSRSTDLVIRMSPMASPMEFNLSAEFLVPSTDSIGNFRLRSIDTLQHKNLAPLLRFSPRRFTLQPDQEQVVRVSVPDWKTLADGEYWARIITSAKTVPVNDPINGQSLSISMGLELRTIAGIMFRKGSLQTGIHVLSTKYYQQEEKVFIDVDIDRLGNAAWIGTVEFALMNEEGRTVFSQSMISNVYTKGTYRYVLDLDHALKGPYTLEISWLSKREHWTLPLVNAKNVRESLSIILA